jgi:hypothetical protein
VPPLGPQPVADGTAVEDTDELANTLTAFAGDGVEERSPEQTAVALFAAARGYHRREDKPFWWAHFDRLNNPVDEWGDNSDVFVADAVGEVVKDWHLPSTRTKAAALGEADRRHWPRADLDRSVFALYDPPSPTGLTDNPDRRAAGNAEILDVDDPNIPTEVTICRTGTQGRRDVSQVPFALTPGDPIPTGKLRESIDAAAAAVAAGLPALPDSAIVDILLRRSPRTRSGAPLPHTGDTTSDITEVITAVLDLDSSYLAVHGPPGTGKTYTAARSSPGWSTTTSGGSASSHSRMQWWRTCSRRDHSRRRRCADRQEGLTAGRRAGRTIDEDDYAAFIADA